MRRLAFASIGAVLLAAVLVVGSGLNNSPICAIYDSSNPEWWLFFCYL